MLTDEQILAIAKDLTKAQLEALIDGRVHDCPYNHPAGTRCPNCSKWPFKKGGAAAFCLAVRAHIEGKNDAD